MGSKNRKKITKIQKNGINTIAWSPDGKFIALNSDYNTIQIYDSEFGQLLNVLESHTEPVVFISFFGNGVFLGSLSIKGAFIIWRTDTWTEVNNIKKICSAGSLSNLAFHPTLPLIATPGVKDNLINIWNLDLKAFLKNTSSTMHYINAKAVLVGESGVGKSGLGIRLAEKKFRVTESTMVPSSGKFQYLKALSKTKSFKI